MKAFITKETAASLTIFSLHENNWKLVALVLNKDFTFIYVSDVTQII